MQANPDVLADGLYDEKRPAHAAFTFENVARDRNRDEIPPVKDQVRENLGKARLNPIYAQALVAAAREVMVAGGELLGGGVISGR